ncbi:phosphonate metabolism protein/1,5-bisphosphokinase (PRPP-forming) PhnN [Bradyrhizobium sp. LHD-71]|uniref:phosphonate metabolism protein/1,5-bisphosphokinase (PRPP-forming) PhnN n=1 Tax=Bradyrhizobium sp. LHD-71 TaxID=3072141 RepID=UPI00280CB8A5|nr:phosphonate metabolism protein/1,5-bisphosphokinase (PRPP-forming) PhnN [Bradyrhizobium sp. LHD-71]MDQ8726520.1 phosphonate metabolism protein/1,5-bisphosphokinase (PRPP-forming) PhnN [Bradyrhizobium sp. LHD-71]
MNDHATIAHPRDERIGPGALVLVVGPSGAGKDTLLGVAQGMLGGSDRIVFPRRIITRAASAFENNEAISRADFDGAVTAGHYALWWRAHDQGYGIGRAIEQDIAANRTVVVNTSRTIIGEARQRYLRLAVVLITAPADVLAERLAARRRASDGDLGGRLQRASIAAEIKPDLVISNVGAVEDGARRLADFIAER